MQQLKQSIVAIPSTPVVSLTRKGHSVVFRCPGTPPVQELFLEKHGVKLGFMSAFVKAATDALQLVPAVNACIGA